MDGGRRFLAGRLHQAEHLTGPLVVPVAKVMDAVLVLDLEVFLVRVTERLGLQSVDLVVHVEIERHGPPPRRQRSLGNRFEGVKPWARPSRRQSASRSRALARSSPAPGAGAPATPARSTPSRCRTRARR